MAEAEVAGPKLEINNIDDLRRLLITLKGGDPEAIQAIANFMNLRSSTERANFTNPVLMLCVAQLNGFSKVFYDGEDWDPFSLVAEAIETATMGYKGFKSNQFVEMTRQTPNLDALQTHGEEVKRGVIQRMFGRGGGE